MTKKASLLDASKYRRRAANLLYGAIRHHEGAFTEEQLLVIKTILKDLALSPETFCLDKVEEIDHQLLDAGLDSIPSGE